jgi:predicted membrane protein
MLIPTAQAGVIADAPSIRDILMNVLRFLLEVLGTIALIALIVAALAYFLASGEGARRRIDTAKIMTVNIVIGLIVAFGAYVILGQIASFL